MKGSALRVNEQEIKEHIASYLVDEESIDNVMSLAKYCADRGHPVVVTADAKKGSRVEVSYDGETWHLKQGKQYQGR